MQLGTAFGAFLDPVADKVSSFLLCLLSLALSLLNLGWPEFYRSIRLMTLYIFFRFFSMTV